MTTLMFTIFLFTQYYNVYSYMTINKYDLSDCVLNPKLVQEIASYKNITKTIMNEVVNNGDTFYNEYANFIDKFGARPAGSVVLEEAIDHMINLTRSNGLETVTTEDVMSPHWVRGSETATMIKPRIKPIAILGLGSSVSTPSGGITAEVIVMRNFNELNETIESNVKGKIVVFDAHYTSYGETVAYRVEGATKAAEKGAVASLIRSVTPFSLYTTHTGSQEYGSNVTKIPTAAITHEDADLLRRLQDRGATIVMSINMTSTLDYKTSRNTLIDLKGCEDREKLVIVSGHIDSWDVGQGAMDDGGGMFISWYVPVIIHKLKLKPRRTLRAILWTSEEPGLVGAIEYLNRHMNELNNINFIMESDEGTFEPLGLDVSGSQNAVCIVAEVLKLFKPIDKLKVSSTVGSDITIFNSKGVPGASLLNKNERYFWYHHSNADTMDVQNKNDVVQCAAFLAAFSYVISDLTEDIPRY
ncbi:carboxypeptidase Q [Papilio machaon]|uniref:carboxypeptidase Q n=1 Tax=Papilio machaon TaxID=76193 RepID=UPI001E662B11|nr:carboxypeptidase Q [Papilio machaon]